MENADLITARIEESKVDEKILLDWMQKFGIHQGSKVWINEDVYCLDIMQMIGGFPTEIDDLKFSSRAFIQLNKETIKNQNEFYNISARQAWRYEQMEKDFNLYFFRFFSPEVVEEQNERINRAIRNWKIRRNPNHWGLDENPEYLLEEEISVFVVSVSNLCKFITKPKNFLCLSIPKTSASRYIPEQKPSLLFKFSRNDVPGVLLNLTKTWKEKVPVDIHNRILRYARETTS